MRSGLLGPTLEIRPEKGPDGTWVRSITVVEAPECSVSSVDTDLTEDVSRVLGLLSDLLDKQQVEGRRLRPDLAGVMSIYLSLPS